MDKKSIFIKSKALIILLTVIFIFLIITGATYAWLTWNSTDNTNITMQIGEYTAVTFNGGNNINATLTPVFNYMDGNATTFTLTNNNNTGDELSFKYNVYLDITNIEDELKNNSFKYILLDNSNNVIAEGDFTKATSASTFLVAEDKDLNSGISSYSFIIYIDGNMENDSKMINKNIEASLRVTVNAIKITPLDNFTYAIGSFNYQDNNIILPPEKVLLLKYNGFDNSVNIPSSYKIDGTNYTPIIYGNSIDNTSTFKGNSAITKVSFAKEVLFADLDNGESLTFNSMTMLFNDCTSLIEVSHIPKTITNISYAFQGCTSLVNAPTIPSMVTNMDNAFSGCTNLEGDITINSNNVIDANNAFLNTSKKLNIIVSKDSVTYNTFKDNIPSNVSINTF